MNYTEATKAASRLAQNEREFISILNYLLIKNGLEPSSRRYKIHMKTLGCNARCPTCEEWKQHGNTNRIRINFYRAFRQILKEPIRKKHIQLLGWEPLLIYEDIRKVITIGSRHNISFDFPTNGSLLSMGRIDELIRAGLKQFTFSLDFPDDRHDRWRNLPNAHQKILDFTAHIQSQGCVVQWNTVVWTFNKDVIPSFFGLYGQVAPDTHNYIPVDVYGGIPGEYLLTYEDRLAIWGWLEKNSASRVRIISAALLNKEPEDNRCFVPVDLVSYKVTEEYIRINPCYYTEGRNYVNPKHFSPSELLDFTRRSVTTGCDLCNADCKNETNNYMRDLIKKYKLSSI